MESQDISITGFSYYRNDRKKRKKTSLRGSGGVMVLFKNNICKGLTKIHSSLKETVWIKLDKHTFHMEQDCYLCCTYLPPLNSNHTSNDKTVFTDLEREISRFSAQSNIILLGDLNARTGYLQEINYNIDHTSVTKIDIEETSYTYRENEDTTINVYGRKLLKLANEANLIIANGKTIGDLNGRFTCHKYDGNSVVDYCLMSCHLYDTARYFKVYDPQFYSDHCPISVALNTHRTIYTTNDDVLQPLPIKYIWDEEGKKSLLN